MTSRKNLKNLIQKIKMFLEKMKDKKSSKLLRILQEQGEKTNKVLWDSQKNQLQYKMIMILIKSLMKFFYIWKNTENLRRHHEIIFKEKKGITKDSRIQILQSLYHLNQVSTLHTLMFRKIDTESSLHLKGFFNQPVNPQNK